MTIAWQDIGESDDCEQISAGTLEAIGRSYDEAKANIADMGGASAAPAVTAPWPDTEEIDVDTITPPAASRAPSVAPAGRGWRRWFSIRAGRRQTDRPANAATR